MKHILVIVGSCRKNGNTEQLADAFIRGAQDAGHRVEKVFLGAKKINGCLDATPAAMVSPVCKRMTGKRSSCCWKSRSPRTGASAVFLDAFCPDKSVY